MSIIINSKLLVLIETKFADEVDVPVSGAGMHKH